MNETTYVDNPKAFWGKEFSDNPLVFSYTWNEVHHLYGLLEDSNIDRFEFLKAFTKDLKNGRLIAIGGHLIGRSDWSKII